MFKQAGDEIRATRGRFERAAILLFNSRIAVAVAAVFALTFACQLVYARERLPPIGGLSLAQLGLPSLDLGKAGEVLRDAGAAAQRQGAGEHVQGFFTEHSALIPWANVVGLVLALALLAWTLWLQMRNYSERLDTGLRK